MGSSSENCILEKNTFLLDKLKNSVMKKILVAINFSAESPAIFKYAMKLAQYFGAEVDIAYVLPELQIGKERGKFFDQARSEHLQMAKEKLEKYVHSQYGKQYYTISVTTHVTIGKVTEEIPELAIQLSSDLLLVGKHIQRKFSFFDDVANSFISSCPCPVMTIPENAKFHAIKRIIYASSFLLEDCAAIFELQEWLKIFKGELICIHVSKDDTQLPKAKRKMSILERLFPQEDITFRCFVSKEDMAIERYTSLHEGDLLCSLHKDQNMFEWLFQPSLSKSLSDNSPRPMVVFHQHMLSIKI